MNKVFYAQVFDKDLKCRVTNIILDSSDIYNWLCVNELEMLIRWVCMMVTTDYKLMYVIKNTLQCYVYNLHIHIKLCILKNIHNLDVQDRDEIY